MGVTPTAGVESVLLLLLLVLTAAEGGTSNKGEVKGETDLTAAAAVVVVLTDDVLGVLPTVLEWSVASGTLGTTSFDLGDKSIGIELASKTLLLALLLPWWSSMVIESATVGELIIR